MSDQVWLLVIGFLLTTVLGGGLGYAFQARAWAHQHDIAKRDNEREQAFKTFEEVSTRMDKRLFRMRRLYWASHQKMIGDGDDAQWEAARADYATAIFEWNDNLNRTLALVQTYFGGAIRQELENGIYEEFAALGRAMTHIVRWVSGGRAERSVLKRFGRRLESLSRRVYRINVDMLRLFEDGALGRRAPREIEGAPAPEKPVLELGSHGRAVHELQQRLRGRGQEGIPLDGDFGPRTLTAVLALQGSHDLDADGVVGPRTWALLAEPPRPGD